MFSNPSHIRRPSDAASKLWGHLLPQKQSSQRPELCPPGLAHPVVPTDKTGTSVRILLHDTRANLEEFSTRVQKLTNHIDETKREISDLHILFQNDHENVIEKTVGLGRFNWVYICVSSMPPMRMSGSGIIRPELGKRLSSDLSCSEQVPGRDSEVYWFSRTGCYSRRRLHQNFPYRSQDRSPR